MAEGGGQGSRGPELKVSLRPLSEGDQALREQTLTPRPAGTTAQRAAERALLRQGGSDSALPTRFTAEEATQSLGTETYFSPHLLLREGKRSL